MKLAPVKQAQAKLFNAPADKGLKSLTLATFKKDRSLTLERDGEGWLLVEDGFEKSRCLSRRKDACCFGKKFSTDILKTSRIFWHSFWGVDSEGKMSAVGEVSGKNTRAQGWKSLRKCGIFPHFNTATK